MPPATCERGRLFGGQDIGIACRNIRPAVELAPAWIAINDGFVTNIFRGPLGGVGDWARLPRRAAIWPLRPYRYKAKGNDSAQEKEFMPWHLMAMYLSWGLGVKAMLQSLATRLIQNSNPMIEKGI